MSYIPIQSHVSRQSCFKAGPSSSWAYLWRVRSLSCWLLPESSKIGKKFRFFHLIKVTLYGPSLVASKGPLTFHSLLLFSFRSTKEYSWKGSTTVQLLDQFRVGQNLKYSIRDMIRISFKHCSSVNCPCQTAGDAF